MPTQGCTTIIMPTLSACPPHSAGSGCDGRRRIMHRMPTRAGSQSSCLANMLLPIAGCVAQCLPRCHLRRRPEGHALLHRPCAAAAAAAEPPHHPGSYLELHQRQRRWPRPQPQPPRHPAAAPARSPAARVSRACSCHPAARRAWRACSCSPAAAARVCRACCRCSAARVCRACCSGGRQSCCPPAAKQGAGTRLF